MNKVTVYASSGGNEIIDTSVSTNNNKVETDDGLKLWSNGLFELYSYQDSSGSSLKRGGVASEFQLKCTDTTKCNTEWSDNNDLSNQEEGIEIALKSASSDGDYYIFGDESTMKISKSS